MHVSIGRLDRYPGSGAAQRVHRRLPYGRFQDDAREDVDFREADGLDSVDGTPLVRLIADAREKTEKAVRNQTGVVDIRVRPMWREWSAIVRVRSRWRPVHCIRRCQPSRAQACRWVLARSPVPRRESNGLGSGLFELRAAA